MKELNVCGYDFPSSITARVAIIAAIEAFKEKGWNEGINQEDFLMIATKAGYSYQTVRMGGTRQYFCPVEDQSDTMAKLTTYGIFFRRVKVRRRYMWFPLKDNCEEALKHRDEIMSDADEAANKLVENKIKTIISNLKQLSKFKKGAMVTARPQKWSSRVPLYTEDQLHKAAASRCVPSGGYDEGMIKGETAMIIEDGLSCLTRFDELHSIRMAVSKEKYNSILKQFDPYILGRVDSAPGLALTYFKITYPKVMCLGFPKIGYIDPTEFKVVSQSDEK